MPRIVEDNEEAGAGPVQPSQPQVAGQIAGVVVVLNVALQVHAWRKRPGGVEPVHRGREISFRKAHVEVVRPERGGEHVLVSPGNRRQRTKTRPGVEPSKVPTAGDRQRRGAVGVGTKFPVHVVITARRNDNAGPDFEWFFEAFPGQIEAGELKEGAIGKRKVHVEMNEVRLAESVERPELIP